MLSNRLKTIASFVKKGSIVLDIGTDHAYLPIHLIKNNISSKVIACDISASALDNAKNNVEKMHIKNIKLVLSDGLKNIKDNFDTITISGMGTKSIIDILSNQELPDNIILSSNNNLYELRIFMNKINYSIASEVVTLEKGIYYDIISYKKGIEKLSYKELLYGKSNSKEYYKYLYDKEKTIFKKLNFKNKIKRFKNLRLLKKLSK